MLSACTIFIGKRQSLWTELDKTETVSCESISPPLNHIGLMDVMLIKDRNSSSFLLKSKSRLNENKFFTYKIPTDGSINEELFVPVSLNPESEWAGSGKGIWGMYESTLENEAQNKTEKVHLKLYSVSNNRKSAKKLAPITLNSNPDKIFLKESRQGLWLVDQKDSKFNLHNLELETNTEKYSTLKMQTSFYAKPSPFTIRSEDNEYAIFLEETGGDLIAEEAEEGEINIEEYLEADDLTTPSINLETNPITNTFKLQALNSQDATTLELPTKQGIENWSIHPHNSGFYLAYLEGDSLIGQAKLHIANYLISNSKQELVWFKTFPMNHIHVGDIEWIDLKNGKVQLHFLKWLDGEATLASFNLAQTEVNPIENKGVFPSGSTLMGVFAPKTDNDLYYALIRYSSGAFWQFDVCQLYND